MSIIYKKKIINIIVLKMIGKIISKSKSEWYNGLLAISSKKQYNLADSIPKV